MKRVLNIAFLLFFVIGVSSCAKEELDAPSEASSPQAIMSMDSHDDFQTVEDEPATIVPPPAGINDDGDNEEEGVDTSGPAKEGN